MKEEELFYNILKEVERPDGIYYRNELSKAIKKGIKWGFQKGKLEQKKEELEFLEGLDNLTPERNKQIDDKIKQLQKEISSEEGKNE